MRPFLLGLCGVLVACGAVESRPKPPPTSSSTTIAPAPSAHAAPPTASAASVASAGVLGTPAYALPNPLPPTAAKTDPVQVGLDVLKKLFADAKPGTPEHVRTGRALAEACRSLEVRLGDETMDAWLKLAASTSDANRKAKFLENRKAYEAARKCVISAYRAVASMDRSYAKGDEVLLHLSAEYGTRRVFDPAEDEPLRRGDEDKQHATLLQLIGDWPNSKWVPTAYRVFADMYFDKAMADIVDWTIPEGAYVHVHDADPKSIEAAYSSYRLGYVHLHLGDKKQAKKSFERAMTEAAALGNEPHAPEIHTAAQAGHALLP